MTIKQTYGLVLVQTADGWSLHERGSTDEAIATGDAPFLLTGPGEPTQADYTMANSLSVAPDDTDLVGKRVRLVKGVESGPDVYVPSGHEGTVTRVDVDNAIWVKLDDVFAELKEWDNTIQIWDWNGEHDGPEDRARTYIEVIEGGKSDQ